MPSYQYPPWPFGSGVVPAAFAPLTEDGLFTPEGLFTGQATRVAQTLFEGGSFLLPRGARFNRLVFRQIAATLPVSVTIALYQRPGGLSGAASRVATAVFAVPAAGAANRSATLAEGTVTLSSGLVYALIGRSTATGAFTTRTYAQAALDLLTGNVQAATHPTSFTTAFSALAAPPASIDPVVDLVATAVNVVPILRLLTV